VAATSEQLLSGWGRTAPTRAQLAEPNRADELIEMLASRPARGLIARGLGRSYGDAAQCAGGLVVDTARFADIGDVDREEGTVRAGGGASLDALMRRLVPAGSFVPVTPGTRFVTVGGAVAADIHGKNHHRDGSFGSHLESMTLATPTGLRELTPGEDLFWATVGGMGLTGVVIDATLRVIPVETSKMRVDTERASDLDDLMARMEARDAEYRYSVAWIDCLARGGSLGRAVLTRGDHARVEELPQADRAHPLRLEHLDPLLEAPPAPSGLLNHLTVKAFNQLWFLKAPRCERGRIQPLTQFFHPLDRVGSWNRLYGRRGFLQYQMVVPFGAEETLRRSVEKLSRSGMASFLAVLKRFGPPNAGHISFPLAGWTLALDIPVGPFALGVLLDDLDEDVAAAGGRVYLAKDSRLRPDLVASMYPRLDEWRAVREKVDPEGVMCSDLARRLNLLGDGRRKEGG
jgi:decaprenylphospho-beta-D-ribofuranose 2-oxidase